MKKITNLQVGSLVCFLMHAYFIGITFSSVIVSLKQDSYLGIIVGAIIGFIPLLIYLYIFKQVIFMYEEIKLDYQDLNPYLSSDTIYNHFNIYKTNLLKLWEN